MKTERLQLALEAGRTGIWVWDTAAGTFSGDAGISLLWGLPPETPMTMEVFRASWHSDDAARVDESMRLAAAADGPESPRIEFRIHRRDDGAVRWVSIQGRRFFPHGPEGHLELIGMARDVTLRKQREQHTHLLMREVTHRSKNLLAIIQAMARQTVKDSLTASQFEERFSVRLRGLSISHELLAARDWHGAAVQELIRWHLGSLLDKAADRIAIQGPALFLKPEAAQNIGLVLNELITNATRFGALSDESGIVRIAWRLDNADTEPRGFHIEWRETGGPPVSPPGRLGFGHKVMDRLAARALDGTVDLVFAPEGVQWALHIPADFVAEEEVFAEETA